jgi:hypothetical protein
MCPLRNEPQNYVTGVFCRIIRECPQDCRRENIPGGAQPVLALSCDFWFGKNDVHSDLLKPRDLRCVLARPRACATYGKFCGRAAAAKIVKGCGAVAETIACTLTAVGR